MNKLERLLDEIDRQSYPAYKQLRGTYQFQNYMLSIDHVQGDPFASPSRISVHISGKKAGFPQEYYNVKWRQTALEDHLLRCFAQELKIKNTSNRGEHSGSGKSGLLAISRFGQEVLERSASHIDTRSGDIIFRLSAGFPADGRRIRATELRRMLYQVLPGVVEKVLFKNVDKDLLEKCIKLSDEQHIIREEITKMGMVAFVADGSILPRESGVSEKPMKNAVPFESPESMRVTISLPDDKSISGMGIKRGVTLIVGGGYHGKSTLLKALEKGVYPHIAGDGREYVITDDTAFKVRAEDGRSICHTDISLFIHDLPNKRDTADFSTLDASGSTSQAANVIEAIGSGSNTLLMDEDTSATNFMIRDELMAQVVADGKEPIIPFIRRVRDIYDKKGISTVLVAGSCGAFFHVADKIIQMDSYKPIDITEYAKKKAQEFLQDRPKQAQWKETVYDRGILNKASAVKTGRKSAYRGATDRRKLKLMGKDGFSIDRQNVDLRYLEQITDEEQLMAIAKITDYLEQKEFYNETLSKAVDICLAEIAKSGFGPISGGRVLSDMAMPRKQEICGCINRYIKL